MAENHNHDYEAPQVPLMLGPLKTRALLFGVVGLVAWAAMGFINLSAYGSGETHTEGGWRTFFLTYLTGYVFWMSVPIGAMALLLLSTLTTASWGLVFRRIFQAATRSLPMMIVLIVPIVISLFQGTESPFWWVVPAADLEWAQGNKHVVAEQATRQRIFLNVPYFFLWVFGIFAAYLWINYCLNSWGQKSEDERDRASWEKLRRLSGPGFIFWALSFTVLITYLAMSIEPAWFSTMFPVVAGMNMFLTTFAFSAFLFYTLIGRNDKVLEIIKPKFRIDIGSLMFGFTMIWAYATFCQYMLIWAGNLPEEIIYYKKRLEGGWVWMAYALMFVHWFLPFVILLFREVKTSPDRMRWVTLMLLTICAVDVIWWIVPAYPHPGFLHVPMAIAAIVGIGGIWTWFFLGKLGQRNLLPKKDTEFLATWGHH